MKILNKIRLHLSSVRRITNRYGTSLCSKLYIAFDVLYCRIFWHCAYDEYCMYEFYKYRNMYRKDFILQKTKNKYYHKINPHLYTMHKKVFYKAIQSGMQREFIYISDVDEQQFLDFIKKHKKVIVKPDVGSGGKNIKLFQYSDDAQAIAFFHSLTKDFICEEFIAQHDKMNSLNPNCVNTVRIIALCENNDVRFIAASMKCGKFKHSYVDNMHSNGLGANVDVQTGVVTGIGYDYHDNTFIYHPLTGTQIVGFTIPLWEETLNLVKKTHLEISDCPLIGWDVAITNSGPEIVEINGAPGPKLMQLMDQKPKGTILRAYIKRHGSIKKRK